MVRLVIDIWVRIDTGVMRRIIDIGKMIDTGVTPTLYQTWLPQSDSFLQLHIVHLFPARAPFPAAPYRAHGNLAYPSTHKAGRDERFGPFTDTHHSDFGASGSRAQGGSLRLELRGRGEKKRSFRRGGT